MSMTKQHHDSTSNWPKHPKGAGKRSYQKALRQAEKNGTAFYKGKSLTLRALGGTPATSKPEPPKRSKPTRNREHDDIRYLSWNAGSLTTAVWEELLSLLETDAYSDVKIVVVQETHWRGSWQFSKACWHVVSSGTHEEQGAGVMIMVHSSLCQAKDIRFNEVLPGRLLHVRVPGASFSMDVISFYQYVWRSRQTLTQNQEQRKSALDSLSKTVSSLPQRNTLIVAGDFNMSLKTDRKYVGPCTIGVSKLGQRGAKDLHRLLEQQRLVAANIWSVRKPATHVQGEELLSLSSVCRCQLARWQPPFPSHGQDRPQPEIQPRKAYDQLAMEDCYRQASGKITRYTAQVDADLEAQEPSWAGLRSAMEKAMQAEFPRQKGTRPHRATEIWDHHKALRNIPQVLLAFADLHPQLKQRIVWRTWAALERQSAEARTAKQRKFAQRQALIDEQLRQAEAKSATDGSHSLYNVIKTFKRGRPSERIQLRDEQGRFLTATEERKALEDYSCELFGKGEDFQLHGVSGELGITSSAVVEQLRSIKLGKAVPKNCPPIAAWRAIGP